ncbi:GrpB family protein [Gemella cuniculi]|uniref:GrpB family protein n=1 Tax=Gemella cuniculi TaxID=150240 RepID=UPI000420A8D8|nr:GrpB family protein [Gemella cuniculi]
MNKRTIKIKKIIDNQKYNDIFDRETKKIKKIPKMPECEFTHIGATSMKNVFGEDIVDILVVVENLHEITTFDEKRLNNINYHRIAHNGIKGVIKYARITDYFNMSYDIALYVVQRETDIHKDFLNSKEIFLDNELKKIYNEFKNNSIEYSFKEYSKRKLEFINKMLKRIKLDD